MEFITNASNIPYYFEQDFVSEVSTCLPSYLLLTCVCVCTLPPVGFFRLHDVCDIRERFRSTIFCSEYFQGLLPSSFISISESIIFHLQRRNLQPTATVEKANDIMLAFEKMIYIDIGYNSARRQKPIVTERY